MEIVALVGEGNGGKTTKLKKVILELCDNKGADIQNVAGVNRCSTFITPQRLSNCTLKHYMDGHWDVSVVVKYNGKRIGITTIGDTWKLIEKEFNKMGCCDVLVCACHDQTVVFGEMKKYKAPGAAQVNNIKRVENVKCITNDDGKASSIYSDCCGLVDDKIVNEIISLL